MARHIAKFPSVRPARAPRRARSARRVSYKLASYKRPHGLSKDIKGGGQVIILSYILLSLDVSRIGLEDRCASHRLALARCG